VKVGTFHIAELRTASEGRYVSHCWTKNGKWNSVHFTKLSY